MTRIAKLYMQLARGQGLSFQEFERILRAFSYELDRQNGSHRVYKHPSVPDRVTIQPRGKHAKPYQLRQFLDIVEKYGLTLTDSSEDEM
jgi:predicted RNA binding protein YcfA (HicA-like mRNA interferase family)